MLFRSVSARLLLVIPIVANEPLSYRAIKRSFALTRGAAGRLVGVSILYFIVAGVLATAVTSVVGVIARLTLGDGGATLAVAIASGRNLGISDSSISTRI